MSPHAVLHNCSSHVVLQLLLTEWHLVIPCCYSCETPPCQHAAFLTTFSLWVFIVHVPFPFLHGETKAPAAYMHFAGPLHPLLHTALPQGTQPSLTGISKSSDKSWRRSISRGYSLRFTHYVIWTESSQRNRDTYASAVHVTYPHTPQIGNFSGSTHFKEQTGNYCISPQVKKGFQRVYDLRGLLRRFPQTQFNFLFLSTGDRPL